MTLILLFVSTLLSSGDSVESVGTEWSVAVTAAVSVGTSVGISVVGNEVGATVSVGSVSVSS